MSEITVCAGCKKPITEGSLVELESSSRFFHEECFNCSHCSGSLLEKEYIEEGDKPLHSECYHMLYNPKCSVCQEPVEEDYLEMESNVYHQDCLTCSACKNSVGGNKFYNMDGGIQCVKCYSSSAPSCSICQLKILNQVVSALGHNWHKTCFVCSFCKKELCDSEFVLIDELFLHQDCYNQMYFKNCCYCEKKVSTKYMQIDKDHYYHLECRIKKEKEEAAKKVRNLLNRPEWTWGNRKKKKPRSQWVSIRF